MISPISEFEQQVHANCHCDGIPQPTEQELLERYEEQQQRLACPGCGEEPFLD